MTKPMKRECFRRISQKRDTLGSDPKVSHLPTIARSEVPLFPKINVASSFFQRMRGLLGSPPEPQLLMIAPCHSIHTYGMRYPIHVAFFDQDGIVLDAERSVPPGTKRSCDNACGVLEMPAVFENDHWFVSGDHLRLAPPEVSHL